MWKEWRRGKGGRERHGEICERKKTGKEKEAKMVSKGKPGRTGKRKGEKERQRVKDWKRAI